MTRDKIILSLLDQGIISCIAGDYEYSCMAEPVITLEKNTEKPITIEAYTQIQPQTQTQAQILTQVLAANPTILVETSVEAECKAYMTPNQVYEVIETGEQYLYSNETSEYILSGAKKGQ